MKKLSVSRLIILLGLVFNVNFLLAQNSINGTIVDTEDGAAIPGASVFILGTTNGTATDFDGNFTITTSKDFPIQIEISSLGYTSQIIDVTSADQELSIQLELGSDFLDEVIISASRRAEKIVDAPASVSVISARKIANSAEAIDPMRHLMNVPGVTIQQQTANSMNIEMRAGNGLFGTAVLPLLDYRIISTPAARSNFSYQYGLSNLDLERIEVIRGTNSALYGPGVEGGVVHFITKKAIDHPGTSAELYTGNLSSRGGAVRHAHANKSKTFGYKINVKYNEGNDFGLDLAEDAERISTFYTSIVQPK
ncbi:MAG: carboxypeptidase-like regulatory domain-containing protein, partial [Bacteroidota bacterium]|nr:carboxypeptidase-like regulatory domain-containing protein [Bacteroidota bacterium]